MKNASSHSESFPAQPQSKACIKTPPAPHPRDPALLYPPPRGNSSPSPRSEAIPRWEQPWGSTAMGYSLHPSRAPRGILHPLPGAATQHFSAQREHWTWNSTPCSEKGCVSSCCRSSSCRPCTYLDPASMLCLRQCYCINVGIIKSCVSEQEASESPEGEAVPSHPHSLQTLGTEFGSGRRKCILQIQFGGGTKRHLKPSQGILRHSSRACAVKAGVEALGNFMKEGMLLNFTLS